MEYQKNGMNNFDLFFLIWSGIRPILVVVVCILLVMSAVYAAADIFLNRFWLPVDETDHTPIQIVIPSGSSTAKIANIIEENSLVKNADVFEYYIDFSGYANKMKAGTYALNKQMTMHEIMEKLAKGDGRSTVTTFSLVEGLTIEEMAQSLVTQGIIESPDEFKELARRGEEFMSYTFISNIDEEDLIGRNYILEGYLFPDKYEIYVGSTEATIMKRMLNKFNSVMNETYTARADELGLSVDEIITLASIIEREAKPNDFSKVSAVFHNRLKKDMKLQSCATVQYVLGIRKLNLSDEDISVDSFYNTYKYAGIPVGPICSPSQKAIEAALYPDEEYLDDGYLFFATKDPESGELIFNITAEEHQKAVDLYRPLWQEYDKSKGY
jgi:UPF0755 protein